MLLKIRKSLREQKVCHGERIELVDEGGVRLVEIIVRQMLLYAL